MLTGLQDISGVFKRMVNLKRVTAVECTLILNAILASSISEKAFGKCPSLFGTLFAHKGLTSVLLV